MRFREFFESNRPYVKPSYSYFSNMNAHHIVPGTKIYRGLKIPNDYFKKMNVRQILMQGVNFKKGKNESDPWSLEFSVAERFASGAAIDSKGYSLGLQNTVHIIVEAELEGPNRDQIDWNYWGKTISGDGISKGFGVNSYWNPRMMGKVGKEDYHIENEIPVLHSAYPRLKLTALYVKDSKGWKKTTESNVLG